MGAITGIGTGSGYCAAVVSRIVSEVFFVERIGSLCDSACERFKVLDYSNISVRYGDGIYGWKEHAPYDAIIITCAVNHVPPILIQQLVDGGKMVLPLGSTEYFQILTLIEKDGDELVVTYLSEASSVPMVGEATNNN